MRIVTVALSVLGLVGVSTGPALAQAVGQADVQIQSLSVVKRLVIGNQPIRPVAVKTLSTTPTRNAQLPNQIPATDQLDIQVVVFSNNDDDARNVRLHVIFPPETRILAAPSNCVGGPGGIGGPGTVNAYAICSIGTLTVGASQMVRLSISLPPSYVVPRVGVFAWSDTSDPNSANNHAEQVAQ